MYITYLVLSVLFIVFLAIHLYDLPKLDSFDKSLAIITLGAFIVIASGYTPSWMPLALGLICSLVITLAALNKPMAKFELMKLNSSDQKFVIAVLAGIAFAASVQLLVIVNYLVDILNKVGQ